ncbi:MAG: hypothetical protein HKN46_00620 [Acidimicrobiia bacterium]|nr:hypothetical protein [Acidimicrobiia bacterium]
MTVHPLQSALATGLRFLLGTVWVSVPLLLLDGQVAGDQLLTRVTIHLAVVVAVGFGLSVALLRLTDEPWFATSRPVGRWLATGAAHVILVTGVVALLVLPSSSALRYEPSLQFLQLISALDIAWVTAATTVGLRWRFGRSAGLVGGAAVASVCVWSLWRYLDRVGFTADGGWLVDQEALASLVLPLDVAAAVVALASLGLGIAARQATEQRSPQS